eukprot:3983897-Amphidinium_carterae.2
MTTTLQRWPQSLTPVSAHFQPHRKGRPSGYYPPARVGAKGGPGHVYRKCRLQVPDARRDRTVSGTAGLMWRWMRLHLPKDWPMGVSVTLTWTQYMGLVRHGAPETLIMLKLPERTTSARAPFVQEANKGSGARGSSSPMEED